jgi:hypothetical protein
MIFSEIVGSSALYLYGSSGKVYFFEVVTVVAMGAEQGGLDKKLGLELIALERMKTVQWLVPSPAAFYFEKGLDVKYAK